MVAPLRVLYFGTPRFAVPTLERLIASPHEVVGVVTQPDRPRGRGQKVTASPVKVVAVAHQIPVLQPTQLRDAAWLDEVAALRADIGVVAAYGRILPQALLDLPPRGLINVHASLLPRWRGAAPIHRAVLAGDDVTGVTIMRVVLALDAGSMLARIETPIAADDTSETLEVRLAAVGADLLVKTLDHLSAGPEDEVPQDDTLVTYAERVQRAESVVNWAQPAARIDRQVRGLQPWPLAVVHVETRSVALLHSFVVDHESLQGAPGTIVAATQDALHVACAPGVLAITQVKPEGRRPMAVRDFLNGAGPLVGTVLT
ncbi:MAG: methionyl-tRNA formyltransferase [Acidobacteria bacterium]|nr:methionyl-tRNA formyltransferase [Acidobacteriota bacterium]